MPHLLWREIKKIKMPILPPRRRKISKIMWKYVYGRPSPNSDPEATRNRRRKKCVGGHRISSWWVCCASQEGPARGQLHGLSKGGSPATLHPRTKGLQGRHPGSGLGHTITQSRVSWIQGTGEAGPPCGDLQALWWQHSMAEVPKSSSHTDPQTLTRGSEFLMPQS